MYHANLPRATRVTLADGRDVSDVVRDVTIRVTVAVKEFGYRIDTLNATFTRMDRAIWPTLPWWKRVLRTMRRTGW